MLPPHHQGARRFGNHDWEQIQPIVDALGELGRVHGGKTPSQVALNWLISKGAVPIPGAKNAAQVGGRLGSGILVRSLPSPPACRGLWHDSWRLCPSLTPFWEHAGGGKLWSAGLAAHGG